MLDDGERAPPGGLAALAGAGEAATGLLYDRERTTWRLSRAGAAAMGVLEDGERAPPAAQPGRRGCAITTSVRHCDPAAQPGLGASATGVIDDGERAPSGSCEPIAMSREMVAKRRGEPKRVTGTAGSRVASRAAGVEPVRGRARQLERRSWRARRSGNGSAASGSRQPQRGNAGSR